MPKVLFTIGSFGLGGAESQMALLIRELIRRGWKCECFVLDARGPLRSSLDSCGVVIHDGGYDSAATCWCKPFQLVRAFFRLWVVALRTRPHVLHAYLPLTGFVGSLAGSMAGVRLIITSRRALGTHQDRYPLWKPFDRMANLLSDYVIANSRAVADDTTARDGIDRRKLRVIPNGIDVSRFDVALAKRATMRRLLGLEVGTIGIVAVGNLIPYKGHADLLRALSDVVKGETIVRVFLVGEDRGIGTSLKRLAKELGISRQVVFLGRREDVPEIMAAMDIFVMASHEEGFSNALLEAMASGLAVVATDVGGNREALAGGELGILVPPHDPVALATAMNRLLADRNMRFQLGHAAKHSVSSRYSVEAMVDAHVALYRREFVMYMRR